MTTKQTGTASVNASWPGRVRGETGLLPFMNTSASEEHLMERVVDQSNIMHALGRVKQNGGSPGIDGMTGRLTAPLSSVFDSETYIYLV